MHATSAPLPGDVDFGEGVQPQRDVWLLTAWQGLFEHGRRLRAGQSVLVHGAAVA